jgi:hypothetical protein
LCDTSRYTFTLSVGNPARCYRRVGAYAALTFY